MSTYPRLQGKRGKKYQEKKRKQREKKLKVYRDNEIDTSQFLGVDYEDSIFIPEASQPSDTEEQNDRYANPSLRRYQRIDMSGIDNFYDTVDSGEVTSDKEEVAVGSYRIDTAPSPYVSASEGDDTSEKESELESENEDQENSEESDSEEMPLPTFLLNSNDYRQEPDFGDEETIQNLGTSKRNEHKVKKRMPFAKAKEKGIVRSMTFLVNNELLNSFSFVPFPVDADFIRKTINKYCEKFDLLMHTEKIDSWYYVTVTKPNGWTKSAKASKKGKKPEGRDITGAKTKLARHRTPSQPAQKTLMEGLSTPIGDDNIGNSMLKKMGWEGGALGQQQDGIVEPIHIHIKRDNKGIGAEGGFSGAHSQSSMSFVRPSKH